MKKTKNILKEAVVLLMVITIVFSTVALANIKTQSQITLITSNYNSNIKARGKIVWDNGIDYESMARAQWDGLQIVEDSVLADDFILDDTVEIVRIKWIGGYWGDDYQNLWSDWIISFWNDSGFPQPLGNDVWAPSYFRVIADYDDITKVFLKDTGNQIYYEMTYNLPVDKWNVFDAGKRYWVSIIGNLWMDPPPYEYSGWGFHKTAKLYPAVWGSYSGGITYWTPGIDILGFDFDMAFQLFEKSAEVCCDGELIWDDVTAGGTVSGSFKILNCGESYTMLDWEVGEYPTWGTGWTFSPDSGIDLKPEDGGVTIAVQAIAPTRINKKFDGKIKLVNKDNPNDYCEIDVSLTTPRTRMINPIFINLLQRFFSQFPAIHWILNPR